MHDLVGYCPLLWDWDDDKARINLRKHKIPFELAVRIFHDPLHNSIEDDYEFEERWKTIGQVKKPCLNCHPYRSNGRFAGPNYQCAEGDKI